jgi:hypothetical protein
VTTAISALGPKALAESTATMLVPWQAEEIAHGRPEYKSATEIKEGPYGVDETIEFIEGRQSEAEAWLAENEPPVKGDGDGSAPSGGSDSRSSARGASFPGSVIVNGFLVDHGVLLSRLGFSGPGMVTQWVTMHTPGGRRNVCTVQGQPVSSTATIRCELSGSARRRLAKHRLRLGVNINFAPQGGGTPVAVHRVFAAGRGS